MVLLAQNPTSAALLAQRGFKAGDVVSADPKKARNPRFWAKVHAFGQAVGDNIEAFSGKDAHEVIKALQLDGDIGCENIVVGTGDEAMIYRIPVSLSFDSLDETEFQALWNQFTKHVVKKYYDNLPESAREFIDSFMQ